MDSEPFHKRRFAYLAQAIGHHDHGLPVTTCFPLLGGTCTGPPLFALEDIHPPRLSPGLEPLDEFRPGRHDKLGSKSLSQLVPWTRDELETELLGPSQSVIGSSSGSERVDDFEWKSVLMGMIRQMMFVSGETSEASVETTTIIEEIVHTQVTEIVSL
jgi:hypothetical protein